MPKRICKASSFVHIAGLALSIFSGAYLLVHQQLRIQFESNVSDKVNNIILNATYTDTETLNAANTHIEHIFEDNEQTTAGSSSTHLGLLRTQYPESYHRITPSPQVLTQKVYVLPNAKDRKNIKKQAVLYHFILDGIKSSSLLSYAKKEGDQNAIWVVDVTRYPNPSHLLKKIKNRIQRTKELRRDKSIRPWKVFLVDTSDEGYTHAFALAEKISVAFNSTKYVYLVTRVNMLGRNITHEPNETDLVPFHEYGTPVDYSTYSNANVRHLAGIELFRYPVRSDLVECINNLLLSKYSMILHNLPGKDYSNQIFDLSRPKDVAHFWKVESDETSAKHRTWISRALQVLHNEHQGNVSVLVDEIGSRRGTGRNFVQEGYALAMLEHKIIVVCQRDHWEDHYRLMEGFVSGAMVMTDPMHPLPLHIEDGVSVVVYKSVKELKDKIMYFLTRPEERIKIAKKGYEVAMTEHRSWHFMERLVLSDWKK